jgi:hypothetical protein
MSHSKRSPLVWGPAAIGGLGYGLALGRTLYEIDPLLFGGGGGLFITIGVTAISMGLALGSDRFFGNERTSPAFFPLWLAWIHVLMPAHDVNLPRGIALLIGAPLLTALLWWQRPEDREHPAEVFIAGGFAFLVYLLTLQRTIGRADTFEFQVTAPVLGVAHPTGYPLYILLGRLFSLLPIGSIATRVNLTSAVFAAVSTGLVFLAARRTLALARPVAALAALGFAFSPTLWSQAVIAEVYALHSAFVAAILGGMLWLLARPDALLRQQARMVAVLFLLIGLSFANHLTTALLLPALAVTLLLARPHLTWRQWGLAAALLAAGLLLYAYIPLRWPALHGGQAMRLDEFVGWVTGQRFRGALQLNLWMEDPGRWSIIGRLVTAEYHWIGLGLGVLGLVALVIRKWQAALITALIYFAYVFYTVNYLIPDINVYLIPMHLIQALWMAVGVHAVLERLPIHHLRAALISGFALLPLALLWSGFPHFDWDDEQALERWGREVLALPLAQDSAILADSEKIAPLEYLHRIEDVRPDMAMIVLATEADYQADLRARLAAGQAVYLARYLPGLEGEFYLRSVGPLIEVSTSPLTQLPPLDEELTYTWEDGIRLLGYRAERMDAPAGGSLGLTLYWTLDEPIAHNYAVRLRLVGADGAAVWENQPAYPVSGRYPTAAWEHGEVIPDYHELTLPYALPPGEYALEAALAPLFGGESASLASGESWARVATIIVARPTRPPADLQRQLAIRLPGWVLLDADLPETAPGGSHAAVTLTWRTAPSAGALDAALEGGSTTTSITLPAPGESAAVQSVHAVQIPSGESVTWRLVANDLHCGWLQARSDGCSLGTTAVAGEDAANTIANFDNLVLLTGLEIERDRLRPGETLDVTLTWQSLRAMTEDYTVFVHLLGPDGQLHGQVDAWPVQGTYPTSTWTPGETVVDHYQVPLDYDAPEGSYQVEIGFYLLATNTRLSVIAPDGTPLDDRVLTGGLIVAVD